MEDPVLTLGGVAVLPSHVDAPGLGVVPANAFLIDGEEPLLVDSGIIFEQDAFFDALCQVIDPSDLRWLWLTHGDPDHIGCVHRLLREAPSLRVITTYIGAARLGLVGPVPAQRLHLLNPGQSIALADRVLTAVRLPTFDAPETTGFFDRSSGALFSSDCFGAVLGNPTYDASEIPPAELADRQRIWASVDSPWLRDIDPDAYRRSVDTIRALAPTVIFSSHLPIARGITDRMLQTMSGFAGLEPFVGPDQAALAAMLGAGGLGASPPAP